MKLIITSCSDIDYWYVKSIGQVFKVEDDLGDKYEIEDTDFPGVSYRVDKTDCEVLQDV